MLAGLISTASKARKNERTLADTSLEMKVISHCESGGLEGYKPSLTNIAKMKLKRQPDVVEYSRMTVPESVHMGSQRSRWLPELKRNQEVLQRRIESHKRTIGKGQQPEGTRDVR